MFDSLVGDDSLKRMVSEKFFQRVIYILLGAPETEIGILISSFCVSLLPSLRIVQKGNYRRVSRCLCRSLSLCLREVLILLLYRGYI